LKLTINLLIVEPLNVLVNQMIKISI